MDIEVVAYNVQTGLLTTSSFLVEFFENGKISVKQVTLSTRMVFYDLSRVRDLMRFSCEILSKWTVLKQQS